MISLSLAEIASIVGGLQHDIPDDGRRVTGPVVADSRAVCPGALFVAFAGERADGHDFAPGAVEAGAVAVLAARPVGVPAIVVDDVVAALGALARAVVGRLGTTVVGLTGSAGEDQHQGPDRPAAAALRSDGLAGGQPQQRDRAAADRAARR